MEEGWNFTPIVIPLIALFVGWVLGYFDSNNRTAKKIKQAEDTAAFAIKNAEDKLAQVTSKVAEAPTIPYSVDDPGLLRIKNEGGNLTLDLDGERVNPTALTAEERKRLIEMLNVMRPWLEGKPSPAPVSAPLKLKPLSLSTSIAPVPPQPVVREPAATPKASSSKTKKADQPEPPPTSIAGQINLVLQAQIVNTPLASRGVVVIESPSGGVNIFIGTNKYEGVDEVPEGEIKTAIRTAIAEWEKKYTPGL